MRFSLCLLCLTLPLLVLAQTRSPSEAGWPLVAAHAEGSLRFPEADIIAAAGLKVGTRVTEDDLKRGADRLVASGAFERVAFHYSPAAGGIKAAFDVADAPQFLTVTFDNFVWSTDRQLTEIVRKQVPLFHGELPRDGEMTEQVTRALQEFLTERAIPGEVRFQPQNEQPESSEPTSGIFWVEGLEIPVREIIFPGAGPAEIAPLQDAAKPLLGSSFRRSAVLAFTPRLLAVYRQRGFLKAQFAQPSATLVSSDPPHPVVNVDLPVTPGLPYRLGSFRWTGNHALDSWELNRILNLRADATADGIALETAMERVKAAYLARGYLRQAVHVVPAYDDSAAMVSYELEVEEGSQYMFAGLELEGLDPPLGDRVREVWSLREGEPYDPSYIGRFLKAAQPLLGPGAVTRAEPTVNDETKTVELLLHFDFQKPIEESPKPAVTPKR